MLKLGIIGLHRGSRYIERIGLVKNAYEGIIQMIRGIIHNPNQTWNLEHLVFWGK